MKNTSIYFRICLLMFILANGIGMSFALTYINPAHTNNWAAWRPGIGVALLHASLVMCFIGQALYEQRKNTSIHHTDDGVA